MSGDHRKKEPKGTVQIFPRNRTLPVRAGTPTEGGWLLRAPGKHTELDLIWPGGGTQGEGLMSYLVDVTGKNG